MTLESLMQDVRYGLRLLRKAPAFTLAAVVMLGLGIGSNTAIFSVVDGVLLRPLPFKAPQDVVFLWEGNAAFPEMSIAFPDYVDWEQRSQSFSELGAFRRQAFDLTGKGELPERINARLATHGLLPLLGVQPVLGRTFTQEEDAAGAPVVVLEHGFWLRRFGGRPDALGQTLTLDGTPHEVIGVLPQGLRFYSEADLWAPIRRTPGKALENRGNHPGIYALGRLKPGVTEAQARAELEAIGHALNEETKNPGKVLPRVQAWQESLVEEVQTSLWVLLAAVSLVLLIAAINVANLMLARGTVRARELAVRAALGASRAALVRQLLVESVLVALAGGLLGVLLATWGVQLLAASRPDSIPSAARFGIDLRVLAYALGISVTSGLALGVLQALRASQTNLATAMTAAAATPTLGSTGGRRGPKARDVLVVAEVALALLLTVSAGLLMRSFVRLQGLELGFAPENLLTFRFSVPQARYPDLAQMKRLPEQLAERLRQLPGVESVSFSTALPLAGAPETSFTIDGKPPPPPGENWHTVLYVVNPDYFATMQTPVVQGRALGAQDVEGAPRVAVIDEAFARIHFPGEDPLGKRIDMGPPDKPALVEVVGVARHVQHYGVGGKEPAPVQLYLPIAQVPEPFVANLYRALGMEVRTRGDPLQLVPAARAAVSDVDPDQALSDVKPMEQRVSEALGERRFTLWLVGLFALTALVLSALGIYSVMSYAVAQRTREMGIRMALGARGADVLGLVVGHGFRLALVGVAVGAASAVALTRLMQGLLEGVSSTDPVTFSLTAAGLVAVAVGACWLPARRAVRVDPAVSLRAE